MNDYRIEITVTDGGAGVAWQLIDTERDAVVSEATDLDSVADAVALTLGAHTGNVWTRLAEVSEYARARGIDPADAIRELVNSGLSHARRDESGRIL